MKDIHPQYLRQRNIYVPFKPEEESLELGKLIAQYNANERRLQLTVVAESRQSAEASELGDAEIVTERRGQVSDGGVVLAWCPTHKTMRLLDELQDSIVVVVEFAEPSLKGWAKDVGAYNVFAQSVMTSKITDAGAELITQITTHGYKGWKTDSARAATMELLRELDDIGELEPPVLLERARRAGRGRFQDNLKVVVREYLDGRKRR